VGGIIIVAALAWLGYSSFKESNAYYLRVDEYDSMKQSLGDKPFKLAGDVVADSVDRTKPQMEFVLSSADVKMRVRYVGKGVIPDTFKGGSKALVEGVVGPDGTFQAHRIEAKCASRYEAEYDKRSTS